MLRARLGLRLESYSLSREHASYLNEVAGQGEEKRYHDIGGDQDSKNVFTRVKNSVLSFYRHPGARVLAFSRRFWWQYTPLQKLRACLRGGGRLFIFIIAATVAAHLALAKGIAEQYAPPPRFMTGRLPAGAAGHKRRDGADGGDTTSHHDTASNGGGDSAHSLRTGNNNHSSSLGGMQSSNSSGTSSSNNSTNNNNNNNNNNNSSSSPSHNGTYTNAAANTTNDKYDDYNDDGDDFFDSYYDDGGRGIEEYTLEQWPQVEPTLRAGDLILMRGRGPMSWAITTAQFLHGLWAPQGLRYSHVAVVVRAAGEPLGALASLPPPPPGSFALPADLPHNKATGNSNNNDNNNNDRAVNSSDDNNNRITSTTKNNNTNKSSNSGGSVSPQNHNPPPLPPHPGPRATAGEILRWEEAVADARTFSPSAAASLQSYASHTNRSAADGGERGGSDGREQNAIINNNNNNNNNNDDTNHGVIILEAMDNKEYHVPDVSGVVRYDQVQLVRATDRLASVDPLTGEPAYYYFCVRRLRRDGHDTRLQREARQRQIEERTDRILAGLEVAPAAYAFIKAKEDPAVTFATSPQRRSALFELPLFLRQWRPWAVGGPPELVRAAEREAAAAAEREKDTFNSSSVMNSKSEGEYAGMSADGAAPSQGKARSGWRWRWWWPHRKLTGSSNSNSGGGVCSDDADRYTRNTNGSSTNSTLHCDTSNHNVDEEAIPLADVAAARRHYEESQRRRLDDYCLANVGRRMDANPLYILAFISAPLYALAAPSRFSDNVVSCAELTVELLQALGVVRRRWHWVQLDQQTAATAAAASADRNSSIATIHNHKSNSNDRNSGSDAGVANSGGSSNNSSTAASAALQPSPAAAVTPQQEWEMTAAPLTDVEKKEQAEWQKYAHLLPSTSPPLPPPSSSSLSSSHESSGVTATAVETPSLPLPPSQTREKDAFDVNTLHVKTSDRRRALRTREAPYGRADAILRTPPSARPRPFAPLLDVPPPPWASGVAATAVASAAAFSTSLSHTDAATMPSDSSNGAASDSGGDGKSFPPPSSPSSSLPSLSSAVTDSSSGAAAHSAAAAPPDAVQAMWGIKGPLQAGMVACAPHAFVRSLTPSAASPSGAANDSLPHNNSSNNSNDNNISNNHTQKSSSSHAGAAPPPLRCYQLQYDYAHDALQTAPYQLSEGIDTATFEMADGYYLEPEVRMPIPTNV